MHPYLSIVIPAYKEEQRLPETLMRMKEYFENERKEGYTYEIIVVVDGSPDKTADVARSFIDKLPTLRVIDRAENRGKGYTIAEGMLAANGSVRLFMDADSSTDIAHIEKILPHFRDGKSVVFGSRQAIGADIVIPQGIVRIALGRIGNFIIRLLVLPGIGDTQCGFKALTAEASEKIFPLMTIERWAFDVELLSLARRYGYMYQEVGVRWKNDEASTVKSSAFVTTLLDVIRLRIRLWLGKYPR